MRTHKTPAVLLVVGALLVGLLIYHKTAQAPAKTATKTNALTTTNQQGFNKTRYSVSEAGSLWWIVNKTRPLPNGYVPPNLVVPPVSLRLDASSEQMHLRQDTASAVEQLFEASHSAGYPLTLASGYRSAAYQTSLYNSYVAKDGQAAADRYSAKPNTSEHQTGLALDVCVYKSPCDLEQSFGSTPTGKWLAENAHLYGFIVRYLDGKEAVTGYEYEPWHIRYVGRDLAAELHETGQTMEEFFGVGSNTQ